MAGFARPEQGRGVSFLHWCGEGESVRESGLASAKMEIVGFDTLFKVRQQNN